MNWLSFLSYSLTTLFTPGPNTITAMSNGSGYGLRRGMFLNTGIFAGQFTVLFSSLFFCSLLELLIPKIAVPMKILGAIYILWLAWRFLRKGTKALETKNQNGKWSDGLVIALINPKYWVFAMMTMEAYILPASNSWREKLSLTVLMYFLGACAVFCWCCFGSAFRKLFSEHAKIVNLILSLLLVYCAISLFL